MHDFSKSLYYKRQCFFSPVKIKSARESPFLLFLRFFSRVEISFSRPLFRKFSRVVQGFHGQYLINFHGWNFYFHGRNAENFHGRVFFFTGRILDQCYAIPPPNFFAAGFLCILHEQSPILTGHFF